MTISDLIKYAMVDLSNDTFDPSLYDRDNGVGAAANAIRHLADNEQQMRQNMAVAVGILTDDLTDKELAVLNIVALTDADPHGRIFDYEQVKSLFTDGGSKMHEETKNALARVVLARL